MTVQTSISPSGAHQSTSITAESPSAEEKQPIQAIAGQALCDSCQAPSSLKCGRCRLVCYCSADCQRAAWKTHHQRICVPDSTPERYQALDSSGLTPLHYAVLYGRERSLPPAQQALLTTVNDSFNGTPADLQAHLAPVTDGVISLHMINDKGQVTSITQEQFLSLTGVRFKDGYVASPDALLYLHHRRTQQDSYPNCISPLAEEITEFETAPPTVYLAEEPGMGFGIKAGQQIKEGAVICHLGGELVLEKHNNYRAHMYRFGTNQEYDRFVGPGILINDGPPNCVLTQVKNYKGIPNFSVARAIRDIQPGEYLHVDYGSQHGLRGGEYTISRQSFEEVASFCREGHFYRKSREEKILLYKQYIFGVSSLFILLHLHEVLNINATKRWMASDEGQGFSRISRPLYFPMYHNILDSIRKILLLQKNGQTIVPSICQLPDILSEAALFQILLFMKDDDALSSSSVSSYQALGELIDHIYLAVNGTLTGSYIGRDPGPGQSQIPDIPLDHDWIQSQYSSLPHHLKQDFKQKIRRMISYSEEHNMTDKKHDFQKLDRSLR